MSRICFITAIYGNYETTCKQPIIQTVPADFICFTDNAYIPANGWTIDTTPYHYMYPNHLDTSLCTNSLYRNAHTANIVKYYKQSFKCIPRLHDYDCIVWLDGNIQITHAEVAAYLLAAMQCNLIITWEHTGLNGLLYNEINSHSIEKYASPIWNGQVQPVQDIVSQYNAYNANGYNDQYWKYQNRASNNYGVWRTSFIAFNNKNHTVSQMLNDWYSHTLYYSGHDRLSFSYVCWKLNLHPYTLPNCDVGGSNTNVETEMYLRYQHGY